MNRQLLVGLILTLDAGQAASQTQRAPLFSFCVVPSDTAWRAAYMGFETDNHARIRSTGTSLLSYPIIRDVAPHSPADSAGIRDGDELRAINGFDLVKQHDSARMHGPGVPVVLRIGRGDTTFERVVTPIPPAKPCN